VNLIKKRLGVEVVLTAGQTGQFEVKADGEKIAERGGNWFTQKFGAGYPDLDGIVEEIAKRRENA
jgi:hypothetical protein